MNKAIRDGMVAVLYSPGFGAGWYTWNQEYRDMLFDPGMVDLVQKKDIEKMRVYAELKWPDAYLGGLEGLEIKWLSEGTKFIVNEYDGSESVETIDSTKWLTA